MELSLASAVVSVAGGKLMSALVKRTGSFWSLSNDLQTMMDTMASMAAVLEDANKKPIKEGSVRQWLEQLIFAGLDISDMMDDYQDITDTEATAKESKMFSCFTAARKKMVLANRVKNINKQLESIHEGRHKFNFIGPNAASEDQHPYDVHETLDGKEAGILGRDREKKDITELLSSSHSKDGFTVVPIYGLGGMGKSTLAKLIYNETQFKGYYDHQVWVNVSKEFCLKKIGTSIISQLPPAGLQNTDTLQLIRQCLNNLLHGKKILVILDDIWEEDDSKLKELNCMLDNKDSMVDVILTTRSETIANKIRTNKAYKLQPLNDNICWDIIKRYSGFEDKSNKENLEPVGLDIAKKCCGVALAAQELGFMLKSKDLDGWTEINNSDDIWNKSSGDDDAQHKKVLPSLKLSYEHMRVILRLCFAYCAIFPKGHDIYENYLVHQWVALGFINGPSEGKEYIKELLGISFLQHSNLHSTSRKDYWSSILLTMHTLVHDLALSVSGDQLVVQDANAIDVRSHNNSRGRYALVRNFADTPLDLSSTMPSQLMALRFLEGSKIEKVISFPERLRVLDLSGCTVQKLPDSIGQLKRLRYLNAPAIQNRVVPPFITRLTKLSYLNLRESPKLQDLTESFGNLENLMHLDLSGCSGLPKLPGSFANLRRLMHLDLSGCSCVGRITAILEGLFQLQYLDLSHHCGYSLEDWFHLEDLDKVLPKLTKLRFLGLQSCLDPLCYTLSQEKCRTYVESMITGLVKLEHLDLSQNKFLVELPGNIADLKELHTLDLSGCLRLESLPGSVRELERLRTLELNLSGCPHLRYYQQVHVRCPEHETTFRPLVSGTEQSSPTHLEITEETAN